MSAPQSREEKVAWVARRVRDDLNRTSLMAVLAGVPAEDVADDVRADLQRMLRAQPLDGDYFAEHSYAPVLAWLTGGAS